jgi:signal peptidase II
MIFDKKNHPLKTFSFLSLFFGASGSLLLADQFFKYKIRHNCGFYICNQGISFSLSLNSTIFWIFFVVFLIFFITYILFFIKKNTQSLLFFFSIGLFWGGVFSNILDRLFFGCILDYISLNLKIVPVFNIADIGIFLGAILFLMTLFLKKDPDLGISCG